MHIKIGKFLVILTVFSILAVFPAPSILLSMGWVNGVAKYKSDSFLSFAHDTVSNSYADIGYNKTGVSIKSVTYKTNKNYKDCFYKESDIESVTVSVHRLFSIVRNEEVVVNCI